MGNKLIMCNYKLTYKGKHNYNYKNKHNNNYKNNTILPAPNNQTN